LDSGCHVRASCVGAACVTSVCGDLRWFSAKDGKHWHRNFFTRMTKESNGVS
jgi:hypothetical protein